MNEVSKERTKLLANGLDRASTSCFTVGIATPAAGYLYNVGGLQNAISLLTLTICLVGWLIAAVGLHLLARRVLGGIRA